MNTDGTPRVSAKTIARLCLYRRILNRTLADGIDAIYSHQLATLAGVSAAQVRRDLMAVGYHGSPIRGYDAGRLLDSVGELLDPDEDEGVALVGVGNLGRALMAYFAGRRPKLTIVAGFDSDPDKVNRLIHGCRCYPAAQMAEIIERLKIRSAIIAVPAGEAQHVAETLVGAGVRGILNFAPVVLHVPATVYVEDMDMAVCLEKVAYFARQGRQSARNSIGETSQY